MKSVTQGTGFAVIVAAISAVTLFSQTTGLQRTIVYKADVSVPGREAVLARVELAPGVLAGRHTHPGDEIGQVLEGEAQLMIEGQPTRKVKAGDGFVVQAGLKHDTLNTGTVPLKLAVAYVVEKGKPMATPAAN